MAPKAAAKAKAPKAVPPAPRGFFRGPLPLPGRKPVSLDLYRQAAIRGCEVKHRDQARDKWVLARNRRAQLSAGYIPNEQSVQQYPMIQAPFQQAPLQILPPQYGAQQQFPQQQFSQQQFPQQQFPQQQFAAPAQFAGMPPMQPMQPAPIQGAFQPQQFQPAPISCGAAPVAQQPITYGAMPQQFQPAPAQFGAMPQQQFQYAPAAPQYMMPQQ